MIARPGGAGRHRRLPAVLDRTAVSSRPPGLARGHATLNELTASALSLTDLITSARSQGCVVSIVGLDDADVLRALYRAPLDQPRVVDGARSGPSRPAVVVAPEGSGRRGTARQPVVHGAPRPAR